MYVSTLASATVSVAVTELATAMGLAEELNPILAPATRNPTLAYSLVVASITAAFLLLGAALHGLTRLRPAVAAVGHLGYVAILGFWVADAMRDAVLIASGTEALALLTALSVGSLTCLAASKRFLTKEPTV